MNGSRPIWCALAATTVFAVGIAVGFVLRTRQPGPEILTEYQASSTPSHSAPKGSALSSGTQQMTSGGPHVASASPAELLNGLARLKVTSQEPRSTRALLLALEKLRESGVAALPAIREFLASGQDVDYDAVAGRTVRAGEVPLDFAIPPSLRLGVLEVLKNIGGPEAEAILLYELRSTGRGIEAAYLGGVLQQISKEKFREPALAAARDLLAMPLTTHAQNQLDRSDRDYLYGMLAATGDQTQLAHAQTQLILPNGKVDQGALRYLRQMLGEQVVSIAAQAWEDPRVDPSQREPLARAALAFVGTNTAAEQLYRAAINDLSMSASARKNLIEDLNEAGFADSKHLTAADLPLIQKRLALIEQLAPQAKDRTNAAAFVEARKDLLDMRDTVMAAGTPRKK